MADKKFSELTTASEIKNEDFMALSQDTGGGLVSLKATILAIANKMLKGINFASDLQTTDKTVIGAINEVAQGGGGGGSSTLDGLTDVDIDDTTLADGQALVYNGTSEKWENGQGGGGTGGHTIIDENGNSMTARAGLQFVGGANVSDDATNNKTIVDLASAGGIDGVFVDIGNVIKDDFTFDGTAHSWVATEDCIISGLLVANTSQQSAYVTIDGVFAFTTYESSNGNGIFIPIKKGQTIEYRAKSGSTMEAYGIQTGTTHSKFQPVIYSLEEQKVGVYTDGKPLYEKTIHTGALSTGANNIAHNILNAEHIIQGYGKFFYSTYEGVFPFVSIENDNSWNVSFGGWNSTVIIIEVGSAYSTYPITDSYTTVRYTKSTDTAGSGTWTPQGVPTHHYSTDEQVIGTWNGETLYEKTYFNVLLTNGVENIVDSNFGSDKVLQDFSVKTRGMANTLFNYNSTVSDTLFADNGVLKYYISKTGSWWAALDKVDITIQYTKSSS